MKITIITGASGGIGEAVAKRLAERKHALLLVARNAEKLATQCEALKQQYGTDARFIAADLAKPGAAALIYNLVNQQNLEVEMLINNAGIGSGGEFTGISLQSELALIQLNIASLVALTHLFLPGMQQRRSGTIVNVASMTAFMPVPYMATYAASKVFVRSFTEALTQECRPYNIHMLLFCPGLTKTNFNNAAGINNEKGKGLSSDYSTAPSQTPEQVAGELINALDKGKNVAVAGRLNRLAARLTALIPDRMIAGIMARSYRRQLGMKS